MAFFTMTENTYTHNMHFPASETTTHALLTIRVYQCCNTVTVKQYSLVNKM